MAVNTKSDETEQDRISHIRRLAEHMTQEQAEVHLEAMRQADDYQCNEHAARGDRTSPNVALTIWDELGANYYAAQLALGNDPFAVPH